MPSSSPFLKRWKNPFTGKMMEVLRDPFEKPPLPKTRDYDALAKPFVHLVATASRAPIVAL